MAEDTSTIKDRMKAFIDDTRLAEPSGCIVFMAENEKSGMMVEATGLHMIIFLKTLGGASIEARAAIKYVASTL